MGSGECLEDRRLSHAGRAVTPSTLTRDISNSLAQPPHRASFVSSHVLTDPNDDQEGKINETEGGLWGNGRKR